MPAAPAIALAIVTHAVPSGPNKGAAIAYFNVLNVPADRLMGDGPSRYDAILALLFKAEQMETQP